MSLTQLQGELFSQARLLTRYAAGLPRFLGAPLSLRDCRFRIQRQLRQREESFLRAVKRAIFQHEKSPYRPLFEGAGLDFEKLEHLVRGVGVEGALERLHDSGVYVTLDEFKGRKPIRRGGLTLSVDHSDFDNPVRPGHFEGRTGGSRGSPRRLLVDLDVLTQDAASYGVMLDAWGVARQPMAVWRPVPPDGSGIKKLMMRGRLGGSVERWFTQTPAGSIPGAFRYRSFTALTRWSFNLRGRGFPAAEFTAVGDAVRVARWLAEKKAQGRPAHLDTLVGCAVRVCMAARTEDLDIRGSFFRVGSEPLTQAKADVIARAGCRVSAQYAMAELGPIATGCGAGVAVDDMHLLEDKVAVIQRAGSRGAGQGEDALFLTTVLESCPKLMLNVETGDQGRLETRACGCPLGEVGYGRHLQRLRSYEKLTGEGVTFLGTDLHDLLEDFLPSKFGGHPTDYQLVEEEEEGLTRVTLVVSPRVGEVDETRLVQSFLDRLADRDLGHRLMSGIWEDGQTLRVRREEPLVTGPGKILPLHLVRSL